MTAILPPSVSVMLVRYALDRQRDAGLLRRAGCVAHAAACERQAQQARDVIAAHDEATRADMIASRETFARFMAQDMKGMA